MSSKTIRYEEVPFIYQDLGGRGLTSLLIKAEVNPTCNPLGSENKLIFAPGLFSGTPLVNSSRISVGAKSPLTGTIKESNAGGTMAAALGRLGLAAVGELWVLRINEKGVAEMVTADSFKGWRTYATTPMGADHTAGNLVGPSMVGVLNPLKAEGQMEAFRMAQIRVAAIDSTGLCVFVMGAVNTPEGEEALLRLLKAKSGLEPGPNWLSETGQKILRAEKDFNLRAGFSNKDDRLPAYFYEEPLPPHNTVVLISEEELDGTFSLIQ